MAAVAVPMSMPAEAQGAPPPCVVRSWPLGDRPGRSAVLAAGLLAFALAVGLENSSWSWGLATAALVALAAWRLWVPIVFELGTLGITQQVFLRQFHVPWQAIGRYEIVAEGVFLWRRVEASPWDGLVAIYLPFGACREGVLAYLGYYVDRHD